MTDLLIKRDYQFDARLKVPVDPASTEDRDIWIDTAEGKLGFRIGGVAVLLPLPSELTGGGGGYTQEQIEDFVALMFTDNADIDFSYTDNGPSLPGTVEAVVKNSAVTNAKLADMVASRIKGRASGAGTGPPTDLTPTEVKTLLAIVAADISDFVANARSSISISDTSSLDLSYVAGVISGAVLDSPLLGGQTKAQIQSDIIAAISGGASSAYDTLVEIQAFLQANDSADAALTSGLAIRSRFFAGAVPSGSPTANIDHNLNLTNIHDFTARVFVSATGAQEEYAMVGSTANRVVLTDETGANIATGRRIFLTAGV